MKKVQLTQHEWFEALKVPKPHRNKKKYYRKDKHKASWKTGSSVVHLGVLMIE
jgi:hypothetical protein